MSVHATCGSGSVLLWRQCNGYVALIPVLWTTSLYSRNRANTSVKDDVAYVSSSSPGGRTGCVLFVLVYFVYTILKLNKLNAFNVVVLVVGEPAKYHLQR